VSPKSQAYVYPAVPPLVVAVNVTGLFATIVVGLTVKSVVRASALIMTLADFV
jgi:hypothetical protein